MRDGLKKEIGNHLIGSLIIFILAELSWLARGSFSLLKAAPFLAGLILGTFLLDLDHFIYWFFLRPELEESRQAKALCQKREWRELLVLLEKNHKTHNSLIFHHFLFQAVLLVLTFFILSSTNSLFGQGLVLALNGHLLVDIFLDLKKEPDHLKNWLFARSPFASLTLPSLWLWGYFWFYLLIILILSSGLVC